MIRRVDVVWDPFDELDLPFSEMDLSKEVDHLAMGYSVLVMDKAS